MIELKNVSKYYNNNGNVSLGLRNVNLKLNRGDIVAIVGESGAGKSTLLNVICGVDTYEEGEIYFKGNETSYFNQNDMDSFRNKYVGFIYQQYNIIDSYTILENVMLPLLLKGLEYQEAKKAALDIIEKVGLSHRVYNKGIHLSGGEKQRCVIARALASDCDILACDEPTGNLDSKTGDEIIQLIKEVATDKLVLIVTHNYEQVKDICNRTIRISDGEVVQDYSTLDEGSEAAVEDMDLNYKGVAFKNLFRIAFQNIKNTPKKTMFGCLILFLVAFLILFLGMSCLSYNDTRQFTDNDYYKNTMHNRLVVFNKDHSPLDPSAFENIPGTKVENAFYEDTIITVEYPNKRGPRGNFKGVFVNCLPQKYDLVLGTLPEKENDCFILFPKENLEYDPSVLNDRLGKNLYISQLSTLDLKICGYGISNEISQVTFLPGSKDFFPKLSYLYRRDTGGYVSYKSGDEIIQASLKFGALSITDTSGKSKARVVDAKRFRLYYTAPSELDLVSLNLLIRGIYDYAVPNYEIIYQKSSEVEFSVVFPDEFEIEQLFEMTIYADDATSAKKALLNKGYIVVQPGKNGLELTTENQLSYLLVMVICIGASLILLFISYIILIRVYASKMNEYSIIRSLGLLKKDMSKVIYIELFFIGLISCLLSIILFYILFACPISWFKILKFNTFAFSLCFVLGSLIYSLFVAYRYNKKLYKNKSLQSALKEDGGRNA